MQAKPKILIADDELNVLDFLAYNLEREGYFPLLARNGEEALRLAKSERPDLLLLDIIMPDPDGFAVAEHLRSLADQKNLLIVFLTAKSDEESQLKAFQLGADDYITKPIMPRLLMCRIKALLRRRMDSQVLENRMEFGSLIIDREKRLVISDNMPVTLARKEFDLLALLAGRPGKVFQRDEIMKNVWNSDNEISDRTIDVHIRNLRVKIGGRRITTIKGVGYKFEG
ncbi:MAG: response regulator transcription factor [Chitinophagales bacterium]|nr:response regulator transcription factor [Chitinophagales bacterium]